MNIFFTNGDLILISDYEKGIFNLFLDMIRAGP